MPKLRFPKTIEINGETWTIVFQQFIKDPEGKASKQGDKILGLCDPSTNTIKICKGLSYDETIETLCHELIHLCENAYNFTIPHKNVYKLDKGLSAALTQIFIHRRKRV